MKSLTKGLYFLSVGLSSGGGVPLPSMILAGLSRRRNPCDVRSSLSQFPSRRIRLQPTGPNTATRSSYADARFVNTIRSLVTAVAASRLTTSITTGFGSITVASLVINNTKHFRARLRKRVTSSLVTATIFNKLADNRRDPLLSDSRSRLYCWEDRTGSWFKDSASSRGLDWS
jgi:hypothetical protein